MGNSNVTPAARATSFTSPYQTDWRTSVSVINPDISTTPVKSPTHSISFDPPISTSPNHPETYTAPIKSPTPHFSLSPTHPETYTAPVKSPTPRFSASPNHPETYTAPIKSPTSRFSASPFNHDTFATPTKPPTPRTFISPTNPDNSTGPIKSLSPLTSASPTKPRHSADPIKSPAPLTSTSPISRHHSVARVKSPTVSIAFNVSPSAVPVTSTAPTVPVTSSTFVTPVTSPTPTIDDIPNKPPNFIPVLSPDTSVVSPTHDIRISPITSPTPTVAVISVKSTTSPTGIHTVSPSIAIVPTPPIKSTTPRPFDVSPKRTVSKVSIRSSTSTVTKPKPFTLSSGDRWDKWNKFEQKQREKHKPSFHTTQQAQSLDTSTPSSINTNNDLHITPTIPDIIAVPSFSLRSTAVCNPPPDYHVLSERTESIHTDISIFKYRLTQKETKLPIGNHTKATMFQMNTRLKRTPLPTPSLSFLTKNFSDGLNDLDENSKTKPTFDSLGLQNDLETEPFDQTSIKFGLYENQQQKILRPSSFSDSRSNSTNSLQFVSSAVISQPNFSSVQTTRPPLTSILKKPPSQIITDPSSTQTNSKVSQEYRKNDFENNPFTVSFNLPVSSNKASQSILRSEKLFSKRSFYRKN